MVGSPARPARRDEPMTISSLILLYVTGLLGLLAFMGFYYDLRRKQFQPRPTEDHIFRCEKCAFVYTDDADVERSRCPHCGKMNDMIKF